MIKKCQFYTAELAKRANYATSASFGKYMKSILVMTNDAKNYCWHNLQSLVALVRSSTKSILIKDNDYSSQIINIANTLY